MLTLVPYIFSVISLLITIYFVFRKEGQEEKQEVAARLSKIEIEQANQIARQQGFQAEIESVADYGRRERLALMENVNRDHASLRESIKDVPSMRDLLSRMDERFLSTKEELKSVKDDLKALSTKMDTIVGLLTHK